jgi:hypothetical protein
MVKKQQHECVQVEVLKNTQIDVAVLKTNNITMANDIKEMKNDIKAIGCKIDGFMSAITDELNTKATKQELKDKVDSIFDMIRDNRSVGYKLVDWALKVAPWIVLGIVYVKGVI